MTSKETILEKKGREPDRVHACLPLPENPEKFITRDAKKLYHESLYSKTFIAECGFSNFNVYFNFMIWDKGWTKLCSHPPPRIALIVREFHSNLRYRVGSTVYVREKWVNFSVVVINKVYNLVDDDSDTYKALFHNIDYQMILQSLTRGRGVRKQHPSTSEVTTFMMKALKPIPNVWYNFIYSTLKPCLHLSTVTKDKMILLYAII